MANEVLINGVKIDLDKLEKEDPQALKLLNEKREAGTIKIEPVSGMRPSSTLERLNEIQYPSGKNVGLPDEFVKRSLGGLYGGSVGAVQGGPVGALIGALSGGMNPPEKYSDAGIQALMGSMLGKASEAVNGIKTLGSKAGQAIGQGVTGAVGNLSESYLKQYIDNLINPNAKASDAKFLPESASGYLGTGLAAGVPAVGGALTQATKNRMANSPSTKSQELYNLATGKSLQNPSQLPEEMKAIESGNLPNAANTIGKLREDRFKLEKQLRNDINTETQFKGTNDSKIAEEKLNEYQAQRQNSSNLGQDKINQKYLDPKLEAATEAMDNSGRVLRRIDDLEKKARSDKGLSPDESREFMSLSQSKQQHESRYSAAEQASNQIREQNIRKGEDIIAQTHQMPSTESGKQFPANQQTFDSRSEQYKQQFEKSQSDIKITQMQRELDKNKYPLETANILKTGKNSEEVVQKLLTRDVPEIKQFMTTAGKEIPNIKEAAINEVMKQSWNPETGSFSNFSSLYGTQGKAGNIRDRLQYVLGSQDKADQFLDLVTSINKGVADSQMAGQTRTALAKMATMTGIFTLASKAHGGPLALGTELAAMTAISMPRLIDQAMTDPKKYKALKGWVDSGFAKDALVKGNPVYQMLLDMGDHYVIQEDGTPKLVDKSKK